MIQHQVTGLIDPCYLHVSSMWSGAWSGEANEMCGVLQGDFEEAMKGVVCDTHPDVKDEAPQAYKDLSQVFRIHATQHRVFWTR